MEMCIRDRVGAEGAIDTLFDLHGKLLEAPHGEVMGLEMLPEDVYKRQAVNRSTMPRQKTTACRTACARDSPAWLRKNDRMIGIIGKTQGVKMAAKPKLKASRRNAPSP